VTLGITLKQGRREVKTNRKPRDCFPSRYSSRSRPCKILYDRAVVHFDRCKRGGSATDSINYGFAVTRSCWSVSRADFQDRIEVQWVNGQTLPARYVPVLTDAVPRARKLHRLVQEHTVSLNRVSWAVNLQQLHARCDSLSDDAARRCCGSGGRMGGPIRYDDESGCPNAPAMLDPLHCLRQRALKDTCTVIITATVFPSVTCKHPTVSIFTFCLSPSERVRNGHRLAPSAFLRRAALCTADS
jgi:hypothetical protein